MQSDLRQGDIASCNGSPGWTVVYSAICPDSGTPGTNGYYYCIRCGLETDHSFYWEATCYFSGNGANPDGSPPKPSDPTCSAGSIIQAENQVVGEAIPIAGTAYNLVYFSDRVPGAVAEYQINTGLTGSTIDSDLTSIAVHIQYIDRSSQHTYTTPTANMTHTFTWDGLNGSSQVVEGPVMANVRVDRVYASGETDYPPEWTRSVGTWNMFAVGLGGWNIDNHHFYSPEAEKLFLGNGRVRKITATPITGGYRIASEDGTEVYEFNSSGRHIKTRHSLTGANLFQFSYDTVGRLTSISDAFGKVTSINRDTNGIATGITNPFGKTMTLTVNDSGLLSSVTTANSKTYGMTYYSSAGLLQTFETPKGLVSTFVFDSKGRLTGDSNNAGFSWDLVTSISGGGRYATMTSAEGRTTTFNLSSVTDSSFTRTVTTSLGTQSFVSNNTASRTEMNASGSTVITKSNDPRWGDQAPYPSVENFNTPSGSVQSSKTTSLSATLGTSGDPFSLTALTNTTLVNSKQWVSSYDATQKKYTVTSPEGRVRYVTIDSQGQPISDQLGASQAWNFSYDSFGRLSSISQATRDTTFIYDAGNGFISSITDELGQTATYHTDDVGQVTSITLPDTRVIAFAYDSDGNLTSVTPPSVPAHNFTVGLQGDIGTYTPPSLGQGVNVATTYTYNNDRQLTQINRPDGNSITFTYSSRYGTLESITTPAGMNWYGWNSTNGLLSSTSSTDGVSTSISHEGTLVTNESQSGNAVGSIALTYNSNLLLSNSTVTDGTNATSPIAFTYDDDGFVETAGALSVAYDLNKWTIASTTFGNITEALTQNGFQELTGQTASLSGTAFYDMAITRDSLGRIDTQSETVNGTTTTYDYTYDSVGRLTAVEKNGSVYSSYSYDANGNRISRTISGTTASATVDDQDRLLTHGTLSFTHNNNGELATKTDSNGNLVTTYVYDVLGNLQLVTLPSSDVIAYVVDGLNRRVGKSVNGTLQKQWVYQDQLRIAAELASNGALVSRFVYATKANVPDYMIKSGTTYRIISDHLGSVRLVVNSTTGSVAQQIDYDEFGRVLNDTSPGFQPFGFAGGLYDPDTKLVRFGARDYDSETGRWTSKDPILFAGGDTNLFGYTFNDPINFIDPNGMDATDWWNNDGGRNPVTDGPTNGNWGGGNWSGGQGGGGMGNAPPLDSGDSCYMAHDKCYDSCGRTKQCDQDLKNCLNQLPRDPRKWPMPPRSGTEGDSSRYRDGANFIFRGYGR